MVKTLGDLHRVQYPKSSRDSRGLLVVLALLILLGSAATTASVLAAVVSTSTAASTEDVARNRAVLDRVETRTYELCVKIDEIARRANIETSPCPPPETVSPEPAGGSR